MSTKIKNNTSARISDRTKAASKTSPKLTPSSTDVTACVINPELNQPQEAPTAIGKPSNRTEFTISGNAFQLGTIIEKIPGNGNFQDNSYYLVASDIQTSLRGEIKAVKYHQGQSSTGEPLIIPERRPDIDGFTCSWFESMSSAMELVKDKKKWVTLSSNKETEQYEVKDGRSRAPIPEDWPNFKQQLDVAFEGRIIDRLDHPVLKRLGLVLADEEWESDDEL